MMKYLLLIFITLLLTSCVSQRIESLDYLLGQWRVSKYVDEEIWLERENINENIRFTFYKNGDVTFKNKERKPEKEVRKILKKNSTTFCGTGFLHYLNTKFYKIVLRKGKWIVEDNIIKINYFKGEEIESKKYQIKYLTENKLDLEEIKIN